MTSKEIEKLVRKIIKEAPVDYGDYPERMHPRTQARIGIQKEFMQKTELLEKVFLM